MRETILEKLTRIAQSRGVEVRPDMIGWSPQSMQAARLCLRWAALLGAPQPDVQTPTYESRAYWSGRDKQSAAKAQLWTLLNPPDESSDVFKFVEKMTTSTIRSAILPSSYLGNCPR